MLNLYLSQEALGALTERNQPEAAKAPVDAEIEVTCIPVTGSLRAEGDRVRISAWYRDEMNSRTSPVGEAELTLGQPVPETVDRSCVLLYLAGLGACGFLRQQGLLETYSALDAGTQGVEISCQADQLAAKVVTGPERPDLACTDLYGGIRMSRPYMDEILQKNARELLPLEEKEALAQKGDPDMMELLAMGYLNSDGNVPKDPARAIYWYQRLGEQGNSVAEFNLGLFYAQGFQVPRDYEKAASWMERAAAQGEADAEILSRKYALLAKSLPLAHAGDPGAQGETARTLMELSGTLEPEQQKKQLQEAFLWAEQSAEKQDPVGLWTLALCYEHGRGTEENQQKAAELYKAGAGQEDPACLHSLGCYYLRGDVLPLDPEKGYGLCLRAAQLGYGLAMRTVGFCCQSGIGREEDMGEAIFWYEKAQEIDYDPELEKSLGQYRILSDTEQ